MRKKFVLLLALALSMTLAAPAWAAGSRLWNPKITWFTLEEGESVLTYNRKMDWIEIDTGEIKEAKDGGGYLITRLIDRKTGTPINEYDGIGSFSEGLAAVWKWNGDNRKFGFIDKTGKAVIPLEYVSAGGFSDGLAAVSVGSMEAPLYGYINEAGDMVIQPEYDSVEGFSDGIAKVGKKDAYGNLKWGLIDKTGKTIVPLEYDSIAYHEERAGSEEADDADEKNTDDALNQLILVSKTDSEGNLRYGYLDKSFNIAIPLSYDDAGSFVNGLARVGKKDEYGDIKYGYIDRSGNIVVSLSYDDAGPFASELAWVGKKDVNGDIKYGYIDTKGEIVVPLEYEDVHQFYTVRPKNYLQNLYPVAKKDAEGNYEFGYIDEKGNLAIPLQYDLAGFFSEDGLAAVAIVEGDDFFRDRKSGFIDQTGRIVIPLEFSYAEDFRDGIAPVAKLDDDGKPIWGAVNKDGTLIIPFEYYMINTFEDVIEATKRGEDGPGRRELFDKTGRAILPAGYEPAYPATGQNGVLIYSGLIAARKDGETGVGLFNMDGKMALSDEYDGIESYGSIIVVEKNGQTGVFDNPNWKDPDEPSAGGDLPVIPIIAGCAVVIVLIAAVVMVKIKGKRKEPAAVSAPSMSKIPPAAPSQPILSQPILSQPIPPQPTPPQPTPPQPIPPQPASSQPAPPVGKQPDANAPKFCSQCGAPLAPGSKFCPQCGSPIQSR